MPPLMVVALFLQFAKRGPTESVKFEYDLRGSSVSGEIYI